MVFQVIVETPEGRPGPVQKLRVIPVGSNSLELKWDLPLMPNGVIRGYRVYFREVDGLILGQVQNDGSMNPLSIFKSIYGH